MLAADVELTALDARHWRAWWELVVPPRLQPVPAWALIILEDGRPVAMGERALTTAPRGDDDAARAAWVTELGLAGAVAIERRALGELAHEIESGLALDQDLVEQGLVVLRALKRRAGRELWTVPPLLDVLPAPSYEPLQRTFDLLVPDDSALVAYVIDDDRRRVHASVIAEKSGGDIVRVTTHRGLGGAIAEATLARDWEQQYKRVNAAVEERIARPSIAVFLERATLLRVILGPTDQLARELNAKRLVIDPAPAWLLGLLGGAAMAAIAGRAATALAGMLPQRTRDRARGLAGRAREAMAGAHPFALLGFDPLELWARLRHFYR
jgi:hypothetical protein